MAIFKAIEENTLPTEPGRPRGGHEPDMHWILACNIVERYHDAGDRRRQCGLIEPARDKLTYGFSFSALMRSVR